MKWEGFWTTMPELIAGAVIVGIVAFLYKKIKNKWWAK